MKQNESPAEAVKRKNDPEDMTAVHFLKKMVIVLSVILALMLSYLAVRPFLPARGAAAKGEPTGGESGIFAEIAKAIPEPAKTQAEAAPEASESEPQVPEEPEKPVLVLNHKAIQDEVDRVMESYGVMGGQVAIINDGESVGSYAYGWATYDSDPMTVDHKIRVASVSKVIVCMAAMALAEDGVVDLDESIGEYWGVEAVNPYFPDDPVSIRTIMSHTSTIIGYDDYTSVSAGSIRSRLDYGYIQSRPGDLKSWYYNNYAFGVLGATLELASGKILDDVLDEQFFKPLGIDASFAYGDVDNMDLLATIYRGYSVEQSLGFETSLHLNSTPGENALFFPGSLTISAQDLAKLIAVMASGGRYGLLRLLEADSVAQMEKYYRQPLEDGSHQAHPMLYVPDIYGRTGIYYHPGNAYGSYNIVSYDPETGDGVVVLTTGGYGGSDRYEIYSVADEINEYVYPLLSAPDQQ